MNQQSLFPDDRYEPPERERPTIDGETFDYDQDHERLKTCLDRVAHLMGDGKWRTLGQIATAVG